MHNLAEGLGWCMLRANSQIPAIPQSAIPMITVNGSEKPWRKGMTVAELLRIMHYDYPLLAVSVNGTTIHREEYSSFTIKDGSEVQAVHICHGG